MIRRLGAPALVGAVVAVFAFTSAALSTSVACAADVCVGDSWQAAAAAAQPGDVLTVQPGDHGNQTMTAVKAAPGVTFRGGPGVSMRQLSIRDGAAGINVDGLETKVMFVFSSQRVTLSNLDVGDCRTDATINCASKIASSTDVTVTQSRFHDVTTSDSVKYHVDCLFIANGARRVLIERTSFFRCEVTDIFLQTYSPGFPQSSEITLENNWFDAALQGSGARRGTAVRFSSLDKGPYTGTRIAYNSFAADADVNGVAGVSYVGNLYRGHRCEAGATYSHNVIVPFSPTTNNSPCSADGKVVAGFGYVSATDFHLTAGSPGIDAGDPQDAPRLDFDGDARGGTPDAGSDEYGEQPPPPPPPVQCDDGIDNDSDGHVDFPNDPGCTSGADDDETDPTPPPPACPGTTLPLTVVAQDTTTITFGWTPVAGAIGYRFNSTALGDKWTHTWDPNRSTVRFAKGSDCYRVQALDVIADGGIAG